MDNVRAIYILSSRKSTLTTAVLLTSLVADRSIHRPTIVSRFSLFVTLPAAGGSGRGNNLGDHGGASGGGQESTSIGAPNGDNVQRMLPTAIIQPQPYFRINSNIPEILSRTPVHQ